MIGNIGSPEHLDYSVVGETVNLAARLCGYAGPMSAVISDEVRLDIQHDPGFALNTPHKIEIKGFQELVSITEISLSNFRNQPGNVVNE